MRYPPSSSPQVSYRLSPVGKGYPIYVYLAFIAFFNLRMMIDIRRRFLYLIFPFCPHTFPFQQFTQPFRFFFCCKLKCFKAFLDPKWPKTTEFRSDTSENFSKKIMAVQSVGKIYFRHIFHINLNVFVHRILQNETFFNFLKIKNRKKSLGKCRFIIFFR